MTEKRRVYTAEFKREAVRLVTDHGYGVTEAARNLGINVKMLGRWKQQAEQQTNGRFGSNRPMAAENEALLRCARRSSVCAWSGRFEKKPRPSLPKSRVEIRLYSRPPANLAGRGAV